jgi:hypothetical protein
VRAAQRAAAAWRMGNASTQRTSLSMRPSGYNVKLRYAGGRESIA